jgi:hypothetical protein
MACWLDLPLATVKVVVHPWLNLECSISFRSSNSKVVQHSSLNMHHLQH